MAIRRYSFRPMAEGECAILIPFEYRDVDGEEAEAEWKLRLRVIP